MTKFFRLTVMTLTVLIGGAMMTAGCARTVLHDDGSPAVLITPDEGRPLARELRIVWHTRLPIEIVRDIYIEGGRLYVESAYGHLVSIDTMDNGEVRWIRPTRQVLDYPPTSYGDKLFFFTAGHMNVWDKDTGVRIESKDPGLGLVGQPFATERVVMVVTAKGRVHGVGHDSLWPEWTVGMHAAPIRDGAAFTYPDAYVVATMENDVRRYDAVTGSMRWRVSTGDHPLLAAPLVNRRGVFFGARDGFVRALNLGGMEMWRRPAGGTSIAQPAYAHGRLFVIIQPNTVVAMDASNGSILWQQDNVGRFLTATTERAYFLSPGNRTLKAFNMADGEYIGSLDARDFSRFAAEPEAGRFIASTRDGEVYGFVDADEIGEFLE